MRFSYRRYQDGDAPAINELYFQVTGRRRTVEQHAWQWLESPAGESEMWLIEAELDDGSRKLIGHHGVMAEAFTYRGETVRVGKTENTMVHPEFRDKILYPRYERSFLNQYEERFHALFSTMGPEPAIRVRKAMGYESRHKWVNLYWGTEPYMSMSLVLDRYLGSAGALETKLKASALTRIGSAEVSVLDGGSADFDFDDFWAKASANYGLTAARTRVNLNWRFWSNPHHKHHTIRLFDKSLGVGICTVSARSGHVLHVDDIYCERPELLAHFMEVLRRWAETTLGPKTLALQSTSDCIDLFAQGKPRQHAWLHRLAGNRELLHNRWMPRKITPRGKSLGIDEAAAWYVTPFFFEGR